MWLRAWIWLGPRCMDKARTRVGPDKDYFQIRS